MDATTPQAATRVKGVVRRDDTTTRLDICAGGWCMTWAADDRQFVVLSDGVDLPIPPTHAFHSCICTITGDPPDPTVEHVPGYPQMVMRLRESDFASFWGDSCLAVDGRVYQILGTANHPYLLEDGTFWPDFYTAHCKLIYSPDNGVTWHNQDGSTPVVWENWDDLSAENMLFFDEQPEGAFASLTFLQMGKDYQANQDGYVYVYSHNGGEDGTANELDLIRMPKERVLERESYEFFSGIGPDGNATWTSDISGRAPAHVFPRGWVSDRMPGAIPAGWWTSAVYNEPLGLYMLAASGTGRGPKGGWFGKPSYLGFWVAPTPWGPFTQIHEETAWLPEGQAASRSFWPQISPKWISADGTSFWLAWSDYGSHTSADSSGEFNPDYEVNEALGYIPDDAEFARKFRDFVRGHQLNATFNLQRVDLIVE
jgi:hypothetical protein